MAQDARCNGVVVSRTRVMSPLVEACPSFRTPWQAYLAHDAYQEGLLYVDLGEFARHLVRLVESDSRGELPAVFEVIERLLLEGESNARDAVIIGLLEGIQNIASGSRVGPAVFVPYLHPETMHWWTEIDEFWAGSASTDGGPGLDPID